jgi:hypothetical protein
MPVPSSDQECSSRRQEAVVGSFWQLGSGNWELFGTCLLTSSATPKEKEAGREPGLPVIGTATAYWRVRKNPAALAGFTVYGLVAPLTSV